MTYDIIVLGSGPAGLSAAVTARGRNKSVLVVGNRWQDSPLARAERVDNYLGMPGLTGAEMMEQFHRHAQEMGAEFVTGRVISLMEWEGFHLTVGSEVYQGKTLVLAPGVVRQAKYPGEETYLGRGVSYCATCDGMLYRGKTVVVNGGGNTAVGDALYLAKLCKKVYLVHRRDELRASAVYRDALRENGVEILWNSRITALRKEKRLTGVEVEDLRTGARRELFCDGLFVAIGRVPDTALFAGQVELDPSGYIVADETTRTSVPGVFAVGDARTKAVRQIVTAVADGAVAAHYAEEFLLEDAVKDKNLS